jgi:hydroxymethylglutaryl-CoA lyase
LEIGVHLHSRPDCAREKIRAAFEGGCRRFDSCVGGLGNAPFGLDLQAGNVATETLLATLKELGAAVPEIEPLERLIALSAEIERRYGMVVQ